MVQRLPPTSYFLVSSVFHYLGPSFAVLLFTGVDVLGVAWLRIASAAVVFAAWRRPWRVLRAATTDERRIFAGLGAVLAVMNSLFYLAVDRLPLATVGAIEFLGTVLLAAVGSRTARNLLALACCVGGVAVLTACGWWPNPGGSSSPSTFALMLALLPASATLIGLVVLGQAPTARDLLGVALVAVGIALHRER